MHPTTADHSRTRRGERPTGALVAAVTGLVALLVGATLAGCTADSGAADDVEIVLAGGEGKADGLAGMKLIVRADGDQPVAGPTAANGMVADAFTVDYLAKDKIAVRGHWFRVPLWVPARTGGEATLSD